MGFLKRLFGSSAHKQEDKTVPTPLRLKRGKNLGAFVNSSNEVDHLWVSEEWVRQPHEDAASLKTELGVYIAMGEVRKDFTCPIEVNFAYQQAAKLNCLRFVRNPWTDDGGYVVTVDEELLRQRSYDTEGSN